MKENNKFWNSPEAVKIYSADPYLFRGESLAFEECFSDGFKDKKVLDLGCGAGRTTHFLYEMGADVVGVDISENLILAARKNASHLDFREGNAESLDFDNASFDMVLFSFNGLDYLYPKDNRLKAIGEVLRVLRSEGRFVFSHHNSSALLFGWYKNLHPKKLRYRANQIVNGNIFKAECYLYDVVEALGVRTYYAWPNKVITDTCKCGFELVNILPNDPLLHFVQRNLKTNWFTRLADPWPYYVFIKK